MIKIIANPYDNPEYGNYMTDEAFINKFITDNNAKLISVYYNADMQQREYVVETSN